MRKRVVEHVRNILVWLATWGGSLPGQLCYTPLHFMCFSRWSRCFSILRPILAHEIWANRPSLRMQNAQFAVTRVLLNHKVDIAAKDRYGLTALHEACKRGHLAITRVLLNHKEDITTKDRYGLYYVTHSIPHHTQWRRRQ